MPPGALEVFKLPRREVDGSSEDGLNDGTNTAVSSNAFRLTSIASDHRLPVQSARERSTCSRTTPRCCCPPPRSGPCTRSWLAADDRGLGRSRSGFRSDLEQRQSARLPDRRSARSETPSCTSRSARKVMQVVAGGPIPASGPGDDVDIEIGRIRRRQSRDRRASTRTSPVRSSIPTSRLRCSSVAKRPTCRASTTTRRGSAAPIISRSNSSRTPRWDACT